MNKLAIAATATLAIVTIAGLTGTSAARAQIARAVQAVEHPASLRSALAIDPSRTNALCASRPDGVNVLVDANGYPVFIPAALLAQTCR